MSNADLAAFRRSYGSLGERERRPFALGRSKMAATGNGDAKLFLREALHPNQESTLIARTSWPALD